MEKKQSLWPIALIALLPLLTRDLSLAAGWLVGIAVGYVLQRSKFCFASAFRDFFLFGSTGLLKTLLLTIAFTLIGFFLVQSTANFDGDFPPGVFRTVGLHTVIGALLFGLGMTLGGGCIIIGLVRLGEGFFINILTLFAVLAGTFLAILHFPFWQQFSGEAVKIFLPNIFGKVLSLFISLAILCLIMVFLKIKDKQLGALPEYVAVTSEERKIWSPYKTAFSLAFMNTFILVMMGDPILISNVFPNWLGKFLAVFNIDIQNLAFYQKYASKIANKPFWDWDTILIFGIIFGANASAVFTNEFRIKPIRSARQIIFAIIGGILMGYGSRLAMGCTVGALIGGIASMSLHGWVFAFFLPVGVLAGVYILQWSVE